MNYMQSLKQNNPQLYDEYEKFYRRIYQSDFDYSISGDDNLLRYKDQPFTYWIEKLCWNYPHDKEWADELTLLLLAEYYKINVVVYYYNGIITSCLQTYGDDTKTKIYIVNDRNSHYWALLQGDGDFTTETASSSSSVPPLASASTSTTASSSSLLLLH